MSSAINSAWGFLKYSTEDTQGREPWFGGDEGGMPPPAGEGRPIAVPSKEQIEKWTAAEASQVRRDINEVHGPQDHRELGPSMETQGDSEGPRTEFLTDPAFSAGGQ